MPSMAVFEASQRGRSQPPARRSGLDVDLCGDTGTQVATDRTELVVRRHPA
jgi:hypothetical protein